MGNSTIWLSPTDFVTRDSTLQVSHPNTTVTCTSSGDMKWISMGLIPVARYRYVSNY